MVTATYTMGEDYWEAFQLEVDDIEFLYNQMLEIETPLTARELMEELVNERIQRRKLEIEKQRTSGGDLYQPKGEFKPNQKLIFPALGWIRGEVNDTRPGYNPELGEFQVIQVQFDDGSQREFASNLPNHPLNDPPQFVDDFNYLDESTVLKIYSGELLNILEEELETNPDFVYIAGRWFPRALLIDINVGHLNLAEAALDMAGGGPLPTEDLLEQVELPTDVNRKLVEFSLDLSLQEDERFDEVGPAGDVLWYLKRLEPSEVLKPPIYLRYYEVEHDRSVMSESMLALERELDDELSPIGKSYSHLDEGNVRLIFPHWRSGTLPLTNRIHHLFPTAYEAPRIRFTMVDGDTGESFQGWVVREHGYVYGLSGWYESRGVIPGSVINVRTGDRPGEVIVQTGSQRSSREWIRTVLVGSDGGIVFAMLKQIVETPYDERMALVVPDRDALDQVWETRQKEQPPFERIVVNTVQELAKLNPQSHVHASELYAAINVMRRCPPAPILSLLASRPWFIHVGDLHFRLSDTEYD